MHASGLQHRTITGIGQQGPALSMGHCLYKSKDKIGQPGPALHMGHSKANMEESSQPRAALPVGHDPSRNDMEEACLAHGPLPVKVIHEISQPGPAVHVDVATVVPKQPPFFQGQIRHGMHAQSGLDKRRPFRDRSGDEVVLFVFQGRIGQQCMPNPALKK